jgi:hypothetical protein
VCCTDHQVEQSDFFALAEHYSLKDDIVID